MTDIPECLIKLNWVSLAALSVVGAGVLGFVGYKNRKKKKED